MNYMVGRARPGLGVTKRASGPSVVFGLAVLLLALQAISCNNSSRARQASLRLRSLLDSLAQPLDSGPPPSDSARSSGVRLVIDASQSMQGFISNQRDSSSEFSRFVHRLALSLNEDSIYVFGLAGSTPLLVPHPLTRALERRGFYSRQFNPDHILFEVLAADPSPPVVLYVTDGVLSAPDSATNSAVARAIRGWFDRGGTLAVLQQTAQFDGPVWSEQLRRFLPRFAVRRPFYLFVLAKSEGEVDDVLARLPSGFSDESRVLRFPGTPVSCTVKPYRRANYWAVENTPTAWGFIRDESSRALARGRHPVAEIDCRVGTRFPMTRFGVRLESEYHEWNGRAFSSQRSQPAQGTELDVDSVQLSRAAEVRWLRARIVQERNRDYGFYAARLSLGPGRLPDWVHRLSTNTDASLADAGQTYGFAELVEAVASYRLASAARPMSFYLTVEYKKD